MYNKTIAKRANKKNKVEKTIIFGLLLSNLVLGGMYYESNQQLTDVKNHYNYSNELNEELYDELNDVSRELEEQIYKTNSLEKELMEKELEEKKPQEAKDRKRNKFKGKQVICDGKLFDDIKSCAEFYSVDIYAMCRWLSGNSFVPEKFVQLG